VTVLKRLVADISERGALTFADYMQRALYDPEFGYYTSGPARTGWGGHFVTSPEIDPVFGELWAAGIEQIWETCGAPEHFEVVEIGPGEGGFAASVLEYAADRPLGDALTYRLVERNPQARERQKARLAGRSASWSESVKALPPLGAACVIANEVLDNLPVHIFERTGGHLLEVWVRAVDGRLQEALMPPHNPSLTSEVFAPEGHRIEVCPAAADLVATLVGRVVRGALVFIDYGMETEQLAARREGTIACYSDTGTDTDPLERPGEKDITHHVDWGALRHAISAAHAHSIGQLPQADVLRSLGSGEVDERLRAEHQGAVDDKRGVEAVRAISRRQALGALLDPGGLGGLQVMVGLKDINPPAFLSLDQPMP
jgi:SAM-dependent MidA family methyltransferase